MNQISTQASPKFNVNDVIEASHNGFTISFRVDLVSFKHGWYEGVVLACDKPGYDSFNAKAFLTFTDAADPKYGWIKCYSVMDNIRIET